MQRKVPGPAYLLLGAVLISVGAVPATAVHGGADCDSATGLPQCVAHDVLWCVDQTSQVVEDTLGEEAGDVYREVKCKLHSHPPIDVDGDVDPDEKERYGISDGDGTRYDPYIIENWDISGSVKGAPAFEVTHDNGIRIKNTDQHFVVRGNFVHGFSDGDGIAVNDAPNVAITDNRLEGNQDGIDLRNVAGGNQHIHSNVLEGPVGIRTVRVEDKTLRFNEFDVTSWGLVLEDSDQITVADNTVETEHGGIKIEGLQSESVEVLNNRIAYVGSPIYGDDYNWDSVGVLARRIASLDMSYNEIPPDAGSGGQDGSVATAVHAREVGRVDVRLNNDMRCPAECIELRFTDRVHVETSEGLPGTARNEMYCHGSECIWAYDLDRLVVHNNLLDCVDTYVGLRYFRVSDLDVAGNEFVDCNTQVKRDSSM